MPQPIAWGPLPGSPTPKGHCRSIPSPYTLMSLFSLHFYFEKEKLLRHLKLAVRCVIILLQSLAWRPGFELSTFHSRGRHYPTVVQIQHSSPFCSDEYKIASTRILVTSMFCVKAASTPGLLESLFFQKCDLYFSAIKWFFHLYFAFFGSYDLYSRAV